MLVRGIPAEPKKFMEVGIMLRKNVGATDRIIRVTAGVAITALAFVGPQTPWAFLGIVPLLTGLIGWCPPYALLGISTCKSCAAQARKGQ